MVLFRSQQFCEICTVLHHGQSLKQDQCKVTLQACSGACTRLCPVISFWLLYTGEINMTEFPLLVTVKAKFPST